jgi:alanyl-tRNA synthetase
MKLKEVREKYLRYLEKNGHVDIGSSSLLPENDPTTLFTGSGMQPLIPFLLGEKHPQGKRLVNSQKCFRAEDIEEIGDNRHTTFFEMLGNWSLGDYFKEAQLEMFFSFLIEEINIDPNKIYVTVFAGDQKYSLERDNESVAIWQRLFKDKGIEAEVVDDAEKNGMAGGRIFYYGSKKNWWSRAGIPENMPEGEIGGPDSEVFFEFDYVEHDEAFGRHCHPNCDCGRFLEIGNSVFMQYIKKDNRFEELPQKNVDFGGGLMRITVASINDSDVFKTDVFTEIIKQIEKFTEFKYENRQKEFRIIADHLRGVVFLLADGVKPQSSDQGYVLRRLIRRSIIYADKLGIEKNKLTQIADVVLKSHGDFHKYLLEKKEEILSEITKEESRFRKTLAKGIKIFQKIEGDQINGEDAFILFTTYGFPIELIKEISEEQGKTVDIKSFEKKMEEHRDKSRLGAEKKFKGGLADHSEISLKYHTATHMLQAALREILGNHVVQKGSNITADRLRFDFSHDGKMTNEQKEKVQNIVNQKIQEGLPVTYTNMSITKAEDLGALGEFGHKYGDIVKVYTIGTEDNIFSRELCGGPHVENTSVLGKFKILKEESVSAGVRRIKAVLE